MDYKIWTAAAAAAAIKVKGKGKGRVLAIALLTRELVTQSALQSRKWQLIGMS